MLYLLPILLMLGFIVIFCIKFTQQDKHTESTQADAKKVNVLLSNIPNNQKLEVLQLVRTHLNLGLREAKDLLDS